MKIKPQFFRCGCCDAYHSTQWFGDCRENTARFNAEDLDRQYGWNGWTDVTPEKEGE